MKKIILWALSLVTITGCASTQKWICENPKTVAGIAVGAATGGLAGGLIGHQVGHTAGGLLIGSGLGGVAGGLIGNAVENRGVTNESSAYTPSAHYSRSTHSPYDPAVASLQTSLNRRGYECGPVDGIMGSRTRQAVMAFQRDQGLPEDGVAGPATSARLVEVSTSGI